MKIHGHNRFAANRVLFIWDGTDKLIGLADSVAGAIKHASIHAIHLMPHESIRAYGTIGSPQTETPLHERKLRQAFRQVTRQTRLLKHASFEILFGDRIAVASRFASIMKANFILTPRFDQSCFSKWIHGDLNERLVKDSPCRVVFLEPDCDTNGPILLPPLKTSDDQSVN